LEEPEDFSELSLVKEDLGEAIEEATTDSTIMD
jgi:hypothetical protein